MTLSAAPPGGMPAHRVMVLAVGDELLFGDIVNTNAAWLGRELSDAGVSVGRSAVVGDNVADIVAELAVAATDRFTAVLLTGGLGPTQDDLTREAIAAWAGVELVRDPGLEETLRARLTAAGRHVPQRNFRQADLPCGATSLPNRTGTAPGLQLEHAGLVVYALPGPPHELQPMFAEQVRPDLLCRTGGGNVIKHRLLRTAGMWESAVAEALAPEVSRVAAAGNPVVAFLASQGQTRVKITARGASEADADQLIAPVEAFARAALGSALYGTDEDTLEGVVISALAGQRQTLACAESLTGGLLTAAIVAVPGASTVLRGAVVSYATEVKQQLLEIPAAVLARDGVVSAATAEAMAQGARRLLGADWGLSLTGVAGPDPQQGHQPGTVFVGLAGPSRLLSRRLRLPGDRPRVRAYAVVAALDLLRRALVDPGNGTVTEQPSGGTGSADTGRQAGGDL